MFYGFIISFQNWDLQLWLEGPPELNTSKIGRLNIQSRVSKSIIFFAPRINNVFFRTYDFCSLWTSSYFGTSSGGPETVMVPPQ